MTALALLLEGAFRLAGPAVQAQELDPLAGLPGVAGAVEEAPVAAKFCSHCTERVPLVAEVGDECPHCGATWAAYSEVLQQPKMKGAEPTRVGWFEHYAPPERNWIRSGVWSVIGTEFEQNYHVASCPQMLKLDARGLLGWGSAQEALSVGRKPCPICKAPDPGKTPAGKMRNLLEKSSAAMQTAAAVGALGFLSQAADYWQVAWIARGDAFMIAADEEKRRGRIDNARMLYREAGNAYSQATSTQSLPAVPAPGQTMAETGGINLQGMVSGAGGGYSIGSPNIVSGAMGGVVAGF